MPAAKSNSQTQSPFAIFRNRGFSLMWIGQFISTAGTSLTSLAASILVYQKTGSALSVGLMLMATAAPTVLVGLFAGVFVDRYDRKKTMIAADLIRMVLVLLIPFLVQLNIAYLYIIVMLSSAIGQFYDPAHESVLPEVASEKELAAANSLMAISSFGSTAIGFALSGLIAGAGRVEWCFYMDAFSFLASAACIIFLRIKPLEITEKASAQMVVRNLTAGLKFLFGTPVLRSLFYVSIPVLIAFGLSNSLLLPFTDKALHATEFEYGLQEGLTSLGFVVGSLLLAGLFDRLREGHWMVIGYVGMAIAGLAYSVSGNIPLAITIQIISGFMNAPASIGRRVLVQRTTPREMRGRVTSSFAVSRDILFLIGMSAAGLADVINVRIMYAGMSVLVLIGAVGVLVLPGLRQAAAEWSRALSLLRSASSAAGVGAGRAAQLSDLDLLAGLLPAFTGLSAKERSSLATRARVVNAPAGSAIIRHGEASDAAYFILSGRAVAGIAANPTGGNGGNYRSLSIMTPGDFFGEIAALTGAARTANVVAEEDATLLQVPAKALRELMAKPALSQLFLSKMTERLSRTSLNELPRFAGIDQEALKDLRTAQSES
jgi:MFS transporter, DHA3 family, macrolide efflux protein